MEGRKQFTFYRSFYEAASKLSKRSRLGLYEAIMVYALDAIELELSDNQQKAAFILVKPVLDAGIKKAMGGMNSGKTRRSSREDTANKGEKEEENEIEKENETEKEDECMAGAFGEFWDLYPVKLGKEKAFEVWKRLSPDPQAVCDSVKNWLQTRQWEEQNGRFIPRAAKFLEERHYEQLPPGHIPKGASGVLGKAELEAIASIMGNE